MQRENNYDYTDLDDKYTDKTTGVMINLLGITNKEKLSEVEHYITAAKETEILQHNPKIKNAASIMTLHKYLFKDIYPWAGELRTVDISKDTLFFPVHRFDTGIRFLDDKINKVLATSKNDKSMLAKNLAETLDTLNYFHPFREGNGRTQRLAIRLLARGKNHDIDLNPPNNPKIYEYYMKGTIDGNIQNH
jgi:cell filamentation protein